MSSSSSSYAAWETTFRDVQGLGFKGLGFKEWVEKAGKWWGTWGTVIIRFKVWNSGLGFGSPSFVPMSFEFRVWGFGFRASGLDLGVRGLFFGFLG